MTGEQVSWMVVERGWRVVGRGGEVIGRVDEVLGDQKVDIFNGIRVSSGLLTEPIYVPSERIAEIRDGEILLDVEQV